MARGRNIGLKSGFALRAHAAYGGFVLHRVSGVALALFIPVHLYVLSLAIDQGRQLDRLLDWAEQPSVKIAESLLVFLLVLHMAGGVRILVMEFIGWQGRLTVVISSGIGLSLVAGALYVLLAR